MIRKIQNILSYSEKKRYLFVSIITLLITFLELLGLGLIFPLISFLLNYDEFVIKLQKIYFFSDFDFSNKIFFINLSLLIFVVFFFIKGVIQIFLNYYKSLIFYNLISSISNKMYRGYLNLENKKLKKNSSYLIRNIIDFPGAFVTHILLGLYTIIFELVLVLGSIILIFSLDQKLGLIILSSVMVFIIFFYFNSKNVITNYGKSLNNRIAERLKNAREAIEGAFEISLYKKNDYFEKNFFNHNFRAASLTSILTLKETIPKYLLEFLVIFILTLSLYLLHKNEVEILTIIPTLSIIGAALIKSTPSISKILSSIQRMRSNYIVLETLDEEITKFKNLVKFKDFNFSFKENIEFQDIYFSYNSEKKIFNGLNFKIKKNTIFGISGESGSGKTTCLNLLLGFLSPAKGEILVDGKKINKNINNWQKNLALVPQEIFLFEDTLKRNITFGENDNEIDENKLKFSIEKSKLSEFVKTLPNGIEEKILENGNNLSGGQIQRIGIARALYKLPKVLILDEPTSSLDQSTANKILSDLKLLKIEGITLIIVTHDNQIISMCDDFIKLKL